LTDLTDRILSSLPFVHEAISSALLLLTRTTATTESWFH